MGSKDDLLNPVKNICLVAHFHLLVDSEFSSFRIFAFIFANYFYRVTSDNKWNQCYQIEIGSSGKKLQQHWRRRAGWCQVICFNKIVEHFADHWQFAYAKPYGLSTHLTLSLISPISNSIKGWFWWLLISESGISHQKSHIKMKIVFLLALLVGIASARSFSFNRGTSWWRSWNKVPVIFFKRKPAA